MSNKKTEIDPLDLLAEFDYNPAEKKRQRAKLDKQMKEYLNKKGKITKLPTMVAKEYDMDEENIVIPKPRKRR